MAPNKRSAKQKTPAELARERAKVFVPPVWTSSRPKPNFNLDAWEEETAEAMARYTDWHGRHPHMVTPRQADPINHAKILHKLKEDPDTNGKLIYYPNGLMNSPLKSDFLPTVLGADGNFEDASIVAAVYERQANLAGGRDSDDPWYTMSVRDRLEQFHIDGDATSVRTKPKPKPALTLAQKEFAKEEAWQKAEYGNYGGGGPQFGGAKQHILEALTLTHPSATEGKKKIGPWESGYVFTRFTKDGTNLVDFDRQELERRVNRALETFRLMSASAAADAKAQSREAKRRNKMFFFGGDAAIAPESGEGVHGEGSGGTLGAEGDATSLGVTGDGHSGQDPGDGGGQDFADDASSVTGVSGLDDAALQSEDGSDKHGKKKKRKKKDKDKLEKLDFMAELQLATTIEEGTAEGAAEEGGDMEDEDAHLGKYEKMMKKMGGNEECQKKAAEWIKLAAVVRKQSKRDRNMFDLSLDLFDACNNGDLVKVLYCLGVLGLDPNIKTPDDEELCIHMVSKILALDNVTDSLHDDKDESPDRVRLHRVLQALLRFGAELGSAVGKGGQPALHLATSENNSKMVKFLLNNGCSGEQFDYTVQPVRAMMIAAKFGFVRCIAVLLLAGVPVDQKDIIFGRTALHVAGMWGQTRTALFLLQCGADKRLVDRQGKSPGIFAEESGYVVTGQTILTFTAPEFQTMTMLQFYADEIKAKDLLEANPPSILSNILSADNFSVKNASKALAILGDSFTAFVGEVITGVASLARRALGMKKPEKAQQQGEGFGEFE